MPAVAVNHHTTTRTTPRLCDFHSCNAKTVPRPDTIRLRVLPNSHDASPSRSNWNATNYSWYRNVGKCGIKSVGNERDWTRTSHESRAAARAENCEKWSTPLKSWQADQDKSSRFICLPYYDCYDCAGCKLNLVDFITSSYAICRV